MITEPKWKSLIVETIKPIFTPKQCQIIIEAGRNEPKQDASVGNKESIEFLQEKRKERKQARLKEQKLNRSRKEYLNEVVANSYNKILQPELQNTREVNIFLDNANLDTRASYDAMSLLFGINLNTEKDSYTKDQIYKQ